jgi:hypothetical protein
MSGESLIDPRSRPRSNAFRLRTPSASPRRGMRRVAFQWLTTV